MKKQIVLMVVFFGAILFSNSAHAIQKTAVLQTENKEAKLTKHQSRKLERLIKKEHKIKRQDAKANQIEKSKTENKGNVGKNILIAVGNFVKTLKIYNLKEKLSAALEKHGGTGCDFWQ